MGQQEHDHHGDTGTTREQARPAPAYLASKISRALGAHGVLPAPLVVAHPEEKGD